MARPNWLRTAVFNNKKYLARKRFYMQFGFAVLLNLSLAFTGFFTLHWLAAPVLNCWACPFAVMGCPIGILANLAALNLVAIGAVGVLVSTAVVIGRWTCGWVCPFGWLQELFYMIPTPKFQMPRILRHFKYVALALMVFAIPWMLGGGTVSFDDLKPLQDTGNFEAFEDEEPLDGETVPEVAADSNQVLREFASRKLFFCYYCPAGTLQATVPLIISTEPHQVRLDHWRRNQIIEKGLDPEYVSDDDAEYPRLVVDKLEMSAVADKLVILALFLLAFVFIKRPFCRVFCPAGAALGAMSKASLLRLKVDPAKCIKCDACTKRCPQGISIYKPDCPKAECILCNECVVICPTKAISYDNPLRLTEPVEVVADKVSCSCSSGCKDKGEQKPE